MKNYYSFFLLILAVFFMSCEKSQEEKLIATHVQTIGDAKMDLNFDLKNLDKVRDITAKDSLDILKPEFEEKRTEKLSQLNASLEDSTMIEFYQEQIEKYKTDPLYSGEIFEGSIERFESSLSEEKESKERTKEIINTYETDCKGTFLEPIYNRINQYEQTPDKILATEYKVNYSIENPMLNNEKQEFDKIFIINGERTKVLFTE